MPHKQITPLAAARTDALRARIAHLGALYLNDDNYKMLRYEGFSRTHVDRAIETLVQAGEATIETDHGAVRVRSRSPEVGQ